MYSKTLSVFALLALSLLQGGCASMSAPKPSPVPLVSKVDLPRYIGDWYVIGVIPTFVEKGAHNAVESYVLNADGTIATTFRRRQDAFDGPLKVNTPKGFVRPDTGNALWGMQFIWPFKGEFRIAHLEPDYSVTIIGRSKLDYVWLMSRNWQMSDADFAKYRSLIGSWGYDVTKLVRVPQQWPETAAAR